MGKTIIDIGQLQVKYARFSDRFISVYNEYAKRWEIVMEFANRKDREKYIEKTFQV